MYKIIIVEDKKITREGLRQLIDWKQMDAEIAGIFECGNDAIQYLKNRPVDIVLTDIEMDNGTGIDLSEYIHKTYPNIKIIMITAFENFKYAKKALELGVFAYVLKPIQEDEVIEKVKLAIGEIEKEKEKVSLINHLTNQQIEKKIQEFLDGSHSSLAELKEALHLQERTVYFTAVSIKSKDATHIPSQDCRKVLARYVNEFYVIRRNGFLTCILISDSPGAITVEMLNRIYLAIYQNMRVCVGQTVNCLEQLSDSLETSYEAFNQSFLFNTKGVVLYERKPENREFVGTYLEYGYLKQLMFQDRTEEVEEYLEMVFETYQKKFMEQKFILGQCREVLRYLSDVVNEYLMYKSIYNIDYARIEKISDLEEVRDFMMQQVQGMHDLIMQMKDEKIRPIVKLALEYSMEHIADGELNLKTIAKNLKVSYAYLSKAFKEDFRKSYTEYMNLYRIEIAKRQLLNSEEKVYEICEKIGLETKNFYYLFKKYEGITPKEYREIHYIKE